MAAPARICRAVVCFWALGVAAVATSRAQFQELPRAWLPPLMHDPNKLSPDRFVDDECPTIARDEVGRSWVAWTSCQKASPEP